MPHHNHMTPEISPAPSAPPQSMALDRIAFLGGFVPRLCGIATFTHDICEAVAEAAPASLCFAGAVNDRPEGYKYPPRVRFELMEKDLDSYRRAADLLNFNNADVLCVQHEFGIYGGAAGSHILALLKEVRMPVVTTLHTVLRTPDAMQRRVMMELVERSNRVVVMAAKGAEILREIYNVPEAKTDVIPHGIPDIPFVDTNFYKAQFGVEGRTVLLTFGLLGPGKGIEYVIEALPEIVRRHPDVVYLVLGATHPHLVAREGESYRLGLERLAEERGVKDHVIFHNRFVSLEDLKEFIGVTDIYITPYLNEAQITSGTLAYVFGAGKAVVSTPYWHAQELLADDRGILVPFRNSQAIAEGVCEFLGSPERMEKTRQTTYRMGREMIWPAVAKRYLASFQQARAERRAMPRHVPSRWAFAEWTLASRSFDLPPLRLDHIISMTDDTGIFQHAIFNVPNYREGYCTDDNARAFILCNLLDELGGEPPEKTRGDLAKLATIYIAFLSAALNDGGGRSCNFMSHARSWLAVSGTAATGTTATGMIATGTGAIATGSEDSHARALWATGVGAGRSRIDGHRKLSAQLFERGLPLVESFSSPRAWAFTLLGIHEYLRRYTTNPGMNAIRDLLTEKLVTLWRNCATQDWPWFEPSVTYDNARLCQSLILSGQWMPNSELATEALKIGFQSLRWLVSLQKTQKGHFRPIGSNGFYQREGARADFDQQPVEAHAMVSACLEAFRATQDESWFHEAKRAFEWFLGRNDLGLPLYDPSTGGCGDGLHADRVNENQGAESTLAFQLSLAEMNYAQHLMPAPPRSIA